MNLIIVESPTKAKTLETFLGKDYKVLSSFGHVRDLPITSLGIDLEDKFKPKYIIPTKAKKVVSELKKSAKKADSVILAADEDREGEAIAWHLSEVLDLKKSQRIVFHEITKSAIEEALKNPREINKDVVDAQQARRILDRVVGYKLSPFLWKKVAKGLSAGRVQSVAVKLIVEKEREIEKFKPEEYWKVVASLLQAPNSKSQKTKEFEALLKEEIKIKKDVDKIVKELDNAEYIVKKIEKKESKRNPYPPFTTSTLQQEASKRFGFPAKFTMRIAQQLYEKGHITYHRTDSVNLSNLSLGVAKKFITEKYGKNYYKARKYKVKSKAQEAHEAIRPTQPKLAPQDLGGQAFPGDENQKKLYDLIWRRFTACQMSEAIFDSTGIEIQANKHVFKANGQTLKFDGFLKVYPTKFEENDLPTLKEKDKLELKELTPSQHFTQPPARYTEASLVKMLEENEIGRPSTYAPIISTIQARNYVDKNEQKRFIPTEIGLIVTDLLAEHFPEIVDIGFTADLEDKLDKIAEGKEEWEKTLKTFYDPFAKNLEVKYKEVNKKETIMEKTDKKCPKCGTEMIIRLGRFGKFYACPKFPECKHTESMEQSKLNVKCPKCEKGQLTEKRTKKKKIFYGCNSYPDCDFALWDKPTGKKCEKCESLMIEKGKDTKCSNPDCK